MMGKGHKKLKRTMNEDDEESYGETDSSSHMIGKEEEEGGTDDDSRNMSDSGDASEESDNEDGGDGSEEDNDDDSNSDQIDDEASISSFRKKELTDSALNVEANVKKSGVIYLGTIPPGMNVSKLREIMAQYGAIGRIYLEPDMKGRPTKKRKTDTVKHGQKYLEGWIEFKKKSVAKRVAACLNNTQIGGKRRAPYYESLWNIKYLNRFKWRHLTERLVHEKMTRSHRLRQEIAQAKRQTSFYSQNIEKSEMLNRLQSQKAKEGVEFAPLKKFEINQRLTDEEIRNKKDRTAETSKAVGSTGASIKSVLANLFPKR